MPVHRIERAERCQAGPELRHARFEDVQHLERGEPLSGRRQLEHVVAMVVGGDRVDPFGLEVGEVARGHHAAVGLHLLDDRRGDVTLVERVAALLLDQSQGGREPRIADDAVQRRRLIADEECLTESGSARRPLAAPRRSELRRSARPHPSSAIRAARSKASLNVTVPKRFKKRVVAGDRTGDRRRVHAVVRDAL